MKKQLTKISGVTLIELLVGVAVTAIMMGAMFASYTGNEEVDEKEILRWIFNSEWDKVPKNIRDYLEEISANKEIYYEYSNY